MIRKLMVFVCLCLMLSGCGNKTHYADFALKCKQRLDESPELKEIKCAQNDWIVEYKR